MDKLLEELIIEILIKCAPKDVIVMSLVNKFFNKLEERLLRLTVKSRLDLDKLDLRGLKTLAKDIKLFTGHDISGILFNDKLTIFGEVGGQRTIFKCNSPTLLNNGRTKIKQIAFGIHHTIWLTTDNVLYGRGLNYYGQLGLEKEILDPNDILHIVNIKKISAYEYYTLILTNDNKLLFFGKLGQYESKIPKVINEHIDDEIVDISTGSSILVLTKKGHVYSFGQNLAGELGLGHDNPCYKLTKIDLENVACIEAGELINCMVLNDGTVYHTGYNLFKDDTKYYHPTLIPELTNIITISLTCDYLLSLDRFGVLYKNLIPLAKNVIDVKCGNHYCIVLDVEGKIYSFGSNYYGQLGLGHKNPIDGIHKVMSF
jgi:alpha-tubulin suppressor-like RCC1 family protein